MHWIQYLAMSTNVDVGSCKFFLCTLLSYAFALLSLNRFDTIEHSENRIIFQSGMFENEIGPRVFQSSARQTRVLQEYQRHTPRVTDYISILSVLCEILQIICLLITGPEHPRSNLVFEMCDDFIFGMHYCSILRKSCFALSLKGHSTIQPYKVSTLWLESIFQKFCFLLYCAR